jgi:3'-phosphoadenosine 5'-phosphosulfate sulfotransferase (PAPS reductase)/FAD synthetase
MSKKELRHVCGLSGGKDSTALAIYMRDRVPDMEYYFCDTDKELPETYEYLNKIEGYLGKKIARLNANDGFDHWWKVFGNHLPSPNSRWCTKLLKLKPFEKFVGDDNVISYVGIRADENRSGYISTKPNISPVFPFKEDGIDIYGVMKILENSGIGMPPYLEWGRSHSGCYFCFYQKKIEWVRLLERYPKYFDLAQEYEKTSDAPGKTFTWIQGMPLNELKMPKNIEQIKENHELQLERKKQKRTNKKLIEVLGGMEVDKLESAPCLMCQL